MLINNRGAKFKQYSLWFVLIILSAMANAMAEVPVTITAETVIVVNKYGMTAPFLMSWSPVWIFVFAGAVGSSFFKLPDIDKNFSYLLIAKPFLGVFGGMALCLLLSDGSEPPEISLSAYGLVAALLSAPILQGLIAIVTIPRNQASFFNAINPFKFKVVVADNHTDNNKESDNA